MITQEQMSMTEMIMMTYLFDMSEWLIGKKSINLETVKLMKKEQLMALKKDKDTLETAVSNDYLTELSTTISTLEKLPEADFQKMKVEILSWEPSTTMAM